MKRLLRAGYLFDDEAREAENREGRNYWWSYIAEILDRLGLTAEPVSPEILGGLLPELSLLFLGPMDATAFAAELEEWVGSGGTLVGCATEGVDELFGNQLATRVSQERGPFSITERFALRPSEFTEQIPCPLNPDQPLLAASPVRAVSSVCSTELGSGQAGGLVTARQHGAGWAFYFGFDLAQTFWVFQQGRPVDGDYDGDGYLRMGDGIVIEDNDPRVPYTDQLLLVLEKMVAVLRFPLLHRLPPRPDGNAPDAVLYYGGDDERQSDIDLLASEFMCSEGLPYHINAMPDSDGAFAFTGEEALAMRQGGTEVSLHYDFVNGFDHPCGFSREDVQRQTQQFVKAFGRLPVCGSLHYCRWTGWFEPALWMQACGLQAVNGKIHHGSPPMNPVNRIGFSFGTAFPFFYWTDHHHGNRRIEFLDLPIVAYECGYEGREHTDFGRLEEALDVAAHYSMILNVFYHPVYIATFPVCRAAIGRLRELIGQRGLEVLHMAPDGVARWWLARSRSRIAHTRAEEDSLHFEVNCAYPGGCVVKVALGNDEMCDSSFPVQTRSELGQKQALVVLPSGTSQVSLVFGANNGKKL